MTKSIGTVKYQHEVEYDRTGVRKALKVRLDRRGYLGSGVMIR